LKALGLEHLQLRLDQHMRDTDFCRYMPVYEGAQAFVEELKSFAEIVVVTSSFATVPGWEFARRAWLREHFGIEKEDVIFCKRKELVVGNMLLDDKLRNIDAWRNAWGHQGQAVVFDRPWNQGIQYRVDSYAGALQAAREVLATLARRRLSDANFLEQL
jgi:5'(3')-deoxyribonucleotidase